MILKRILIGCGLIILIIVGSIVLFFGVRQFVVHQGAKKIDWKVNDEEYIQTLLEEVSLQHETRYVIDDAVIYLKETELSSEPKQFYSFDIEKWKNSTSMEHKAGRVGKVRIRPALDQFFEQINFKSYGLPEVSLEAGQIVIKKDKDVHSIDVVSEQWYLTHFNQDALILQSYKGESGAYFVFFDEDIEVIPLKENALINNSSVQVFEELLLANPMIQEKHSRFLPFNYSTVWDRKKKQFYTIDEADLLSQDGQSVILNYDRVREENYHFYLLTIEHYIEKNDKQKMIKIPEAAIIKKSTLPASGLGDIGILSFTSDRIIFESNTPSFIFGTAGIVKVSVELTEKKPHYSIIYIEENR